MPNQFGDRMKHTAILAEQITKDLFDGLKLATQCCPNCSHFDEKNELCTAAKPAPARPPARVIAFGCEYFLDVIPF